MASLGAYLHLIQRRESAVQYLHAVKSFDHSAYLFQTFHELIDYFSYLVCKSRFDAQSTYG